MVGTREAEGSFKDMEKAHMKHNGRSAQKEKLNRTTLVIENQKEPERKIQQFEHE